VSSRVTLVLTEKQRNELIGISQWRALPAGYATRVVFRSFKDIQRSFTCLPFYDAMKNRRLLIANLTTSRVLVESVLGSPLPTSTGDSLALYLASIPRFLSRERGNSVVTGPDRVILRGQSRDLKT
jgi:hypothetical protein